MNTLITGGADYIGSHVAKQLLETTQHDIIILDNLSTGYIQTFKTIRDFQVIQVARREGDSTFLVANNTKFLMKMKWQLKYDNLEVICQSTYK